MTRASFSERMAEGKAIAQERRNRGLPTGKPAKGWGKRKQAPIEGLDLVEERYRVWRKNFASQLIAEIEYALYERDMEGFCEV